MLLALSQRAAINELYESHLYRYHIDTHPRGRCITRTDLPNPEEHVLCENLGPHHVWHLCPHGVDLVYATERAVTMMRDREVLWQINFISYRPVMYEGQLALYTSHSIDFTDWTTGTSTKHVRLEQPWRPYATAGGVRVRQQLYDWQGEDLGLVPDHLLYEHKFRCYRDAAGNPFAPTPPFAPIPTTSYTEQFTLIHENKAICDWNGRRRRHGVNVQLLRSILLPELCAFIEGLTHPT